MQNTNQHNDFDLEKEAPILSKIKAQNNFGTPDSYFDELPLVLSQKINPNNKESIWSRFKLNIAIPSVTMLFFAWLFITPNKSQEQITFDLNSDSFYAELISDNDGLDVSIQFEELSTNFEDFEYFEEEEFSFDLPIETNDLELNILFN